MPLNRWLQKICSTDETKFSQRTANTFAWLCYSKDATCSCGPMLICFIHNTLYNNYYYEDNVPTQWAEKKNPTIMPWFRNSSHDIPFISMSWKLQLERISGSGFGLQGNPSPFGSLKTISCPSLVISFPVIPSTKTRVGIPCKLNLSDSSLYKQKEVLLIK